MNEQEQIHIEDHENCRRSKYDPLWCAKHHEDFPSDEKFCCIFAIAWVEALDE